MKELFFLPTELDKALLEEKMDVSNIILWSDISRISVADIMDFLNNIRKRGVLFLLDETGTLRRFYFENGELIFALSNDRRERLGEVLVQNGLITMNQLLEAERELAPGVKLGAVLTAKKFLTSRDLIKGVKLQIKTITKNALLLKKGTLFFAEGNFSRENVVHFTISTRSLILECLREIDEILYTKRLIERFNLKINPSKKITDLPEDHRKIISMLSDEYNLITISKETKLPEEEILNITHKLLKSSYLVPGDEKISPGSNLKPFLEQVNSLLAEAIAYVGEYFGMKGAIERINVFFEGLPEDINRLFDGVRITPRGLNVDKVISNCKNLDQDKLKTTLRTGFQELMDFVLYEVLNTGQRSRAEKLGESFKKIFEMSNV